VVVVRDDVLEPAFDIAAMTANFFHEEMPNRTCPLTIIFEHGCPDPWSGTGEGWYSSTTTKGCDVLAGRTLCPLWERLFSKPGLVLWV